MQRIFYYSYTLIFFLTVSCKSKKQETTIEEFSVINPLLVDTSYINEYVADIQAVQYVEIRTRIQGFVEEIYVDEGKYVQKGQLLFLISSKTLQQHLLKAQSILRSAIAEEKMGEIELQNVEKLVEKNIVSKTELLIAKAKLDVLKAKVEEAKTEEEQAEHNLTYAKIRAPFDGIINRIPFKVGSLVEEGSLLTAISNINEMYAYFHVSEIEYLKYLKKKSSEIKDEIQLVLADGEMHNYKGEIETIEGEIDNSTGSIAFRAKFSNPEKVLKHGSSGKILISKKIKNALIIPQKVSFEIQDKLFVYVVDENNKVSAKTIKVKNRLSKLYVIDGDFKPSDRIIYEGIQSVNDGEIIKPNLISVRKVINNLSNE